MVGLRATWEIKGVNKQDSIQELFVLQKEIMEKVPGGDIPEDMAHRITCGLGIIEETLEYLNSIGRKPWRPQPLSPDKRIEELCDILHFFLELILRSGFTWEQLVNRYKEKYRENLQRYEKGARGDFSWNNRAEKGEL